VSHDLGVIARMCDRIAVMYSGRIIELAEAKDLYARPQHPYTRLLLQSVPVPDPSHRPMKIVQPSDYMAVGSSNVQGCCFHPRCGEAEVECATTEPRLLQISQNGPLVACLPRQRKAEEHRENCRNDDSESEAATRTSSVVERKEMTLGSV